MVAVADTEEATVLVAAALEEAAGLDAEAEVDMAEVVVLEVVGQE